MTTAALQKKIQPLIPKGMTFEGFLKEALFLQLQETNKKIATFEGKYNKSFSEFMGEWKRAKERIKFSYEAESDYMDWEVLETYKRDLMTRIYRSLTVLKRKLYLK